MKLPLENQVILITGITDKNSLSLSCAKKVKEQGATLVCTGLGKTNFHGEISEKAENFLINTYNDFVNTVTDSLGSDTLMFPMDVTLDGSIDEFAVNLKKTGKVLNGVLHSIAMDKTIRAGGAKNLIDVTKEEFYGAMDVSAYSLISLVRSLLKNEVLVNGSSILSLSYLGAERFMQHSYKNIGVAKAALERISVELAFELGRLGGHRVNCIRFSPFAGSKAGGAIPGLVEAIDYAEKKSALGNARANDLAEEVAFLFKPGLRITGEIRHVDGGYNKFA